jgi:hypothetical protein
MDLTNNFTFFYKNLWLWFVTLSFEPFGEILHKKKNLVGNKVIKSIKNFNQISSYNELRKKLPPLRPKVTSYDKYI